MQAEVYALYFLLEVMHASTRTYSLTVLTVLQTYSTVRVAANEHADT